MKIALIGTRGVPANYGGFETCAEELAVGLAAGGHDVVVYCRPGNAEGDPHEYKGVTLCYRRLIETKALGTISHTANCLWHAVRQDFDVLMIFNIANGPLCLIPRIRRQPFAINVDGLEWKRGKWGRIAKLYTQFGAWCSARLATRIVSDSRGIQKYYMERFRTPSTFIPYGAYVEGSVDPSVIEEYDLEPRQFLLVVCRLEPENNADTTVAAFERVTTDKSLVIVGGANWKSPYVERLRRTSDPRVKFLGPVYTPGHLRELFAHCHAYIHGHEVGGTNPALLSALGHGCCVLALDVTFNADVVADAAILYRKDPADLAGKMQKVIDDPDLAADYRRRAPNRIRDAYQWNTVVRDYEELFERMVAGLYDSSRQPSD